MPDKNFNSYLNLHKFKIKPSSNSKHLNVQLKNLILRQLCLKYSKHSLIGDFTAELKAVHDCSVRRTTTNFQEFNLNPSNITNRYQFMRPRKTIRDTFVWHYPKHEFYYAFNKLADAIACCLPLHTEHSGGERKLLGKIMFAEWNFQQHFPSSCLLNAKLCRWSQKAPKSAKN